MFENIYRNFFTIFIFAVSEKSFNFRNSRKNVKIGSSWTEPDIYDTQKKFPRHIMHQQKLQKPAKKFAGRGVRTRDHSIDSEKV